MALISAFKQRCRQPELMDQPGLERGRHFHALRGLERINRWSGSARILWPPIRSLALSVGHRPLRLLDLASGAGDVPIQLWQKARRAGLALEIEGCDLSAQAVEFAHNRAQEATAKVKFFQLDALNEAIPAGYDVVVSSLFLHHLDEDQALGLLRRMAGAARRTILVNDLVRSMLGFALAYVGTRVLSTSEVVRFDGPRSVRAAFTVDEVRSLARQAGLEGATVARRWPCRFLLRWTRP